MYWHGHYKKLLPQSKIIDGNTAAKLIEEATGNIIFELSKQAELIEPGDSNELALDWLNGRRTPDANQLLKGAISGLSLGTDAPKIFRAVAEATCFGAKAIVDRF
jgi:L-ribulokinase